MDNDDEAIVNSIINMAHNMELRVVAEGVENSATVKMLSMLGCDLIQGYHISRPLPAAEMTTMLNNLHWSVGEEAIKAIK